MRFASSLFVNRNKFMGRVVAMLLINKASKAYIVIGASGAVKKLVLRQL